MRPRLYLDIEGTLLLVGAGQVHFRPHLDELLRFLESRRHELDCFWLTSYSRAQVQRLFEASAAHIGYQPWDGCKARALPAHGRVLWVDDRCTDQDRQVLAQLAPGHAVELRPIARWDGDPQDRELHALRLDIEAWLERGAGSAQAPAAASG